jgi:hypothetical protein
MKVYPEKASEFLQQVKAGTSLRFSIAGMEAYQIFGTTVPAGQVVQVVDGLSLAEESVQALTEAVERNDGGIDVVVGATVEGANSTAYFVDWMSSDEANRIRATFGIATVTSEIESSPNALSE